MQVLVLCLKSRHVHGGQKEEVILRTCVYEQELEC